MIRSITAITLIVTLGVLPAGAKMPVECASRFGKGLDAKSNPSSASAAKVKNVKGTRQSGTK